MTSSSLLHLAQELGDLGLDAAAAADIKLVAGIDADHADVLDARFGAVARGQPETASLTLCGAYMPNSIFSSFAHVHRQRWVPKRQCSAPTQVFTVRRLLP